RCCISCSESLDAYWLLLSCFRACFGLRVGDQASPTTRTFAQANPELKRRSVRCMGVELQEALGQLGERRPLTIGIDVFGLTVGDPYLTGVNFLAVDFNATRRDLDVFVGSTCLCHRGTPQEAVSGQKGLK